MINLVGLLGTKLGMGLLAGALALSAAGGFWGGYKWANHGLEKAVATALKEQAKEHAKALKKAVKDERKITGVETKSADTTREFESLTDRSFCPPTSDELRLMEDIAKRTERE